MDRPGATEVTAGRLNDRFGRSATDLRVSLTDRCTLRCTYCMPAEGLAWMPAPELLSDAEVVRLVGVAVEQLGVTEVRFTGGEPLVRRGLERIIGEVAGFRTRHGGRPEVSLTTNGLGLERRAVGLAAAGLDRVNVSLDSLDREQYARLARRDRMPDVLAGIAAAAAAGLRPIKINTVLMRGLNDDQAVPLARWALGEGYQLRFIEQMPLGPRGTWDRSAMLTAADILARLSAAFDLVPARVDRAGAPAEEWAIRDAPPGTPTLGIIAAVTRPFCRACDRTRLTADGKVRSCLFAREETDLRDLLRDGADDRELAAAWAGAMIGKPRAHGIDDPGFTQPDRMMSEIGG